MGMESGTPNMSGDEYRPGSSEFFFSPIRALRRMAAAFGLALVFLPAIAATLTLRW